MGEEWGMVCFLFFCFFPESMTLLPSPDHRRDNSDRPLDFLGTIFSDRPIYYILIWKSIDFLGLWPSHVASLNLSVSIYTGTRAYLYVNRCSGLSSLSAVDIVYCWVASAAFFSHCGLEPVVGWPRMEVWWSNRIIHQLSPEILRHPTCHPTWRQLGNTRSINVYVYGWEIHWTIADGFSRVWWHRRVIKQQRCRRCLKICS